MTTAIVIALLILAGPPVVVSLALLVLDRIVAREERFDDSTFDRERP